MKLTCSRDSLLESINIVLKAVSSRTTLPILECIMLRADINGFQLTANDLELGIQSAPIEADIVEQGAIALEAKIFSEIIRKVNGTMVSISTNNQNVTVISCGTSEFKIMGQSSEDFPELPQVEKHMEYSILQSDLKDMIRQTIFSVAQDETKPVLTGELIEINDTILNIVSVDGYRISYKQITLESPAQNASVIVPGKTLNEISKILSSDSEDKAFIYFTDKHIVFNLNNNIIVSRLIEGEYIKYAQSFTEDYKTKLIIDRVSFIQALERASLISRDSKKTPVKIEITAEELIITANTDMGTAYEEVKIELEGELLKIAFNPKFLIDALKVIEDEKVSIQFTTSLSPCIIRPLEGKEYKYLILPLRI